METERQKTTTIGGLAVFCGLVFLIIVVGEGIVEPLAGWWWGMGVEGLLTVLLLPLASRAGWLAVRR